jgi:hypothetical protein
MEKPNAANRRLNLGTDGPGAREQTRRMRVFCDAYGIEAGANVVDATRAAVASNIVRLREGGTPAAVEWWQRQLAWLDQHRADLAT